MQLSEAKKIRKAWGKKPCNHPNTEKEYFLGSATGDYVCTSCGRAIYDTNRKKLLDIEDGD